jgi:hypothetical protein
VTNQTDALWVQLRARIENIGADLVVIGQAQGMLADPAVAYITISIAVGTLERILYEMRVAGLGPRSQP